MVLMVHKVFKELLVLRAILVYKEQQVLKGFKGSLAHKGFKELLVLKGSKVFRV
jgi:hypothetical protein